MKRQIIRLTESDLHSIIKESVERILSEREEYHGTRHQGNHTLNRFLDDDDFMYIVNNIREEIYGMSEEEMVEHEWNIKEKIGDMVEEVVEEMAKDDFGYKYEHLTHGMKYNLIDDIFTYIVNEEL